MRKLWGRANSSNVMKVVWLMEELSVPYERIDVGGSVRPHHAKPVYLAMNPNSAVPTLQEADGFTLWESNAILRYLASVHADGAPIWPDAPRARANVDRWMDWQQTIMNPPGTIVFQGLVRTAPDRQDKAAIAAGLARLGDAWGLLDRQLTAQDYVAGADFTLADIASGVHVHRWFSFAVAKPDLPHLRAWYDRLLARPPYRRHCAGPMT